MEWESWYEMVCEPSSSQYFGTRISIIDSLTHVLSDLLGQDIVLQPTESVDVRVVHRVCNLLALRSLALHDMLQIPLDRVLDLLVSQCLARSVLDRRSATSLLGVEL